MMPFEALKNALLNHQSSVKVQTVLIHIKAVVLTVVILFVCWVLPQSMVGIGRYEGGIKRPQNCSRT